MSALRSPRTLAWTGAASLALAALASATWADPPADPTVQALQDRPAPAGAAKAKRTFWSRHGKAAVAYTETPFFRPGDDNDLRCNRRAIAAILAGEPPPGQADAGGGAVLEPLTRDVVGRSLGPADEFCADRALEHARDGQAVRWIGADGASFAVIPLRGFRTADGRTCRTHAVQGTMAGRPLRRYGTACRGPGGKWRNAG